MEAKQCPQDCKLCTFQQHAYCAAQLALSNMKSIQMLNERLDKIEASISVFGGGSESYAEPTVEDTTAQSEDGADK